jgi:hypothetical protein
MTREEILDLAKRVEASLPKMTGAMIEDAWEAVAPMFSQDGLADRARDFALKMDARAYLDAAMQLVPQGESWAITNCASPNTVAHVGGYHMGSSPHSAIALTAAALRAIAEGMEP